VKRTLAATQMVASWGRASAAEVASGADWPPVTAKVTLLRAYRHGYLRRERYGRRFLYSVTERGRRALDYARGREQSDDDDAPATAAPRARVNTPVRPPRPPGWDCACDDPDCFPGLHGLCCPPCGVSFGGPEYQPERHFCGRMMIPVREVPAEPPGPHSR